MTNTIESVAKKFISKLQPKRIYHKPILNFELCKLVWIPTGQSYMKEGEEYKLDYAAQMMLQNSFCKPGDKGAMFYGPKGTGKTLNLKIYAEICKGTFVTNFPLMFDVKEFEDEYKKRGQDFFDAMVKRDCLIIDDLGNENFEFIDFGTRRNLIADLLWARYRNFQDWGQVTFITTNLWKDSRGENVIQKLYGDRLYDRMIEMFDMIHIPGESKRK